MKQQMSIPKCRMSFGTGGRFMPFSAVLHEIRAKKFRDERFQ